MCLKRSNLFMAGSGRSRILILTIHNVFVSAGVSLCRRASSVSAVRRRARARHLARSHGGGDPTDKVYMTQSYTLCRVGKRYGCERYIQCKGRAL